MHVSFDIWSYVCLSWYAAGLSSREELRQWQRPALAQQSVETAPETALPSTGARALPHPPLLRVQVVAGAVAVRIAAGRSRHRSSIRVTADRVTAGHSPWLSLAAAAVPPAPTAPVTVNFGKAPSSKQQHSQQSFIIRSVDNYGCTD